jgi:hypothetical protein
VREPTKQELDATLVLSLALDEASAKVRTGPPVDDEEDYELPIWAGILPLPMTPAAPEPDPRLRPEIALPGHVRDWTREHAAPPTLEGGDE